MKYVPKLIKNLPKYTFLKFCLQFQKSFKLPDNEWIFFFQRISEAGIDPYLFPQQRPIEQIRGTGKYCGTFHMVLQLAFETFRCAKH
jgi:hypothetical protein